jgi:hypothetical protein
MPFPFAVIQMVVVTHRLKPLARTSGSFCGGLSGAQRLW